MRCQAATLGLHTSHHHRPDSHTWRWCAAVSALALALWTAVVLCGPQQACWTAEPSPALATKPLEKKPEASPPAHDASQRPAAQMSPEEIYAHASPAVVTLKICNDFHKVTFSGSGFILADGPAKPIQVDADAKRFAADQNDCADAEEFLQRLHPKPAPLALMSSPYIAEHDAFLRSRRKATEQALPNLQQVCIVTNYHVIDSAVSIHVRLHDNSTGFASEVIQEDESADVAILLAWLPCGKRPAAIALSAVPPNVGAKVFVISSPLGLENSLSEGLISGIRELEPGRSLLQTSAAISPGSSGGPIVNANGRVVGIATAIRPRGQNLNFAVPAAEVLRLLEKPPKPREVWRGRSIHQEERYAFDRAEAALKSKKGGAVAAKALVDSQMASLGALFKSKESTELKSVEEAERATIEVIRSVPPEFQYLACFYAGEFQSRQGRLGSPARDSGETRAESTRRARSDPHNLAALAAYRKAVELKPDFAPAYKGLHSIHLRMDDWPEVRRDVDRLMALVPHCASVYEDRATCLSHFGQHEAALKDLKIAADLDPANPFVQSNIASQCMRLAKYDDAIEAYQREAQLLSEKERWLPRYNIGIAHKFSGRYEEAIKAFLRCMKTPDCPDFIIKSCVQQIAVCETVLRKLGRPSPQ